MYQLKHPLIDWLIENEDIEYNLASSSIPDYELSSTCCVDEGQELGHDHEIEEELIERISYFYDEEACPVMAFGAQSANFLALLTILDKDSNVIVEDPTYLPIQKVSESMGNEVRLLNRGYEDRFGIDLDEVKDKFDEDTRAVVITNPHNPSGLYYDIEELKDLQEFLLEEDAYLIVDEVFRDILYNTESAVSLGKNVISTNSVSKVYGMGGLRVGWAVTRDEELADMMESSKVLSLTPASPISQRIALCELKRKDEIIERSRDIADEGLSVVKDWVDKNDKVEWIVPSGGIISFPKLDISCSGKMLAQKARDRGVLVSPGEYFTRTDRYRTHIRLTFGEEPEVIKKGLKTLSRVIDECR